MGLSHTLQRVCSVTATAASFLLTLAPDASAQVNAAVKKYTTTADFNQGTLFNVDTSVPNQLQLSTVVTTFNIMWIANAGEDTVSKVNTTNGREVARYKTWFTGSAGYPDHLYNAYAGAAPSRTAVDSQGNVYVANRHFDGRPPSVLKILASGFVDRNGNGVENTSTDTNGNGTIEPGERIQLVDSNANGVLEPNELLDERVAWVATLPATENGNLGRSLAIDPDGNIWVGCFYSYRYYKLSGATGALISGPHNALSSSPYGAVINGAKILYGASLSTILLEMDTTDPDNPAKKSIYSMPASNYGIAYGLQGGEGHVYLGNTQSYTDFNTVTKVGVVKNGPKYSIGVATDGAGNVLVGAYDGVAKFTPTGALLWQAGLQPGFPSGYSVIIDADQNAWLITSPGIDGKIAKYRGSDGAPLGVFPVGNSPYTYSDATGIQRFTSQRQGTWTVRQTANLPNNVWRVAWNTEPQGSIPANTTLTVEARTSATVPGLGGATYAVVPNGGPTCVSGAVIEVRASLASTVGASPVVSDLTIAGRCDVNGDGSVNSADIQAITNGRNQPTVGSCDLRDGDGNNTIDVNDARVCALRCTKPNCAI